MQVELSQGPFSARSSTLESAELHVDGSLQLGALSIGSSQSSGTLSGPGSASIGSLTLLSGLVSIRAAEVTASLAMQGVAAKIITSGAFSHALLNC